MRDLYQDQIMGNHPSRTWTKKFMTDMISRLSATGWTVELKDIVNTCQSFRLDDARIVVNLVHVPHSTLDSQTWLISDVVSYHQKRFDLYPTVFGNYYEDFDYQESVPTKRFNCFINRGCAFRQSWLYQFVRRQIHDLGNISYWCEARLRNTPPDVYFEELFLEHNQIFSAEHKKLQGKIPYKNFEMSLEQAIIDSERSIVIETAYDPNQFISYSEKTWRALQLPRPVLFFNAQYSVQHLRNWGFDVMDDVVDHSYDQCPDHIQRQVMILDQLNSDIKYDAQRFEQAAKHNRDLLFSFKCQWPVQYEQMMDKITRHFPQK